VTDYAAVYRHFATFAETTVIERGKEEITEDDIDAFLDKFLSRGTFFFYEGVRIPHANTVDPETQLKAFDMSERTGAEAREELKPLLLAKVMETYGSVSDESNDRGWDPTPISRDEYARSFYIEGGGTSEGWEGLSELDKISHPAYGKAQLETKRIKSHISKYFDKVMPFMLRKTMHHSFSIGQYYTRTGKGVVHRNDEFGNPVTINSEEELQNFLSSDYHDSKFPAAKHDGNRFILWNPTDDGRDIKMAVIDIDNPAKIPAIEVRKSVRRIAKKLIGEGHPTIIMFTGGDYQIWIGANDKRPLGDQSEAKDYVITTLFGMGALDRETAIANEVIHIDTMTLSPKQQTRMFFSLHYPTPESKKDFSGLAAVPVTLEDLTAKDFEPYEYAHPDVVRRNFDAYASVVASWFDAVQIGQDYDMPGDIQSAPECVRLDERFPDYEQLKFTHTKSNTIGLTPDKIASSTADETSVYAYAKQRGVDVVLRYDSKGNMKFGEVLRTERVSTDRRGDTVLSTQDITSVLVTASGIVIHSDYLTRDIERYCIGNGINELTLVGQLVLTDDFGTSLDIEDIQFALARKEKLDPSEMRKTRFVCSYIASYNYDEVPLNAMDDEVSKITTNRIFPAPSFSFIAPKIGQKLSKSYESNRNNRLGKDMVIMGEETYMVTSLNKISMTIVGVDKQSKPYAQGSKEIGPVYVALTKNHSKMGPIYYLIGKAEIALTREDRTRLKELVFGKNNKNMIPLNVRRDDFVEQMELAEPSVVVDVVYDDISNTMTNALPTHFLPSTRGKSFRIVDKNAFATKMIGAKIVGIRTDLSALRPGDISHTQDSLIKISNIAPKQGFSILNTLPNPTKKADFLEYYTARMPELVHKDAPWRMSPKSYSKLNKLAKKKGVVGFVKKKSIIYDDDPGWSVIGEYEELLDAAFTFKKITNPFYLRGIDIINATKMVVEYDINYHLIISEGRFYWIYCDIESEELKAKKKEFHETGEGKKVKSILSDMLDVVVSIYSPKEKVTDAVVPGFKLDLLVVEEVKPNPAFSGVESHMGSFYSSPIDAIPLDEPKLMSELHPNDPSKWKYSNDYVYQVGGRMVKPHLFDSSLSIPRRTPAEFEGAYKRQDFYIDKYSLNTTGQSPYYKYTDLPFFMQTAVDDTKNNYGIDGVSIVSMGDTIDKTKSYREAYNATRLLNKEQAKEDLKLVGAQFTSFPGEGEDWENADEDFDFRGYNNKYKAQHKQEEDDLKKSLKRTNFVGFDDAIESILSNPPVKRSAWNQLVSQYIAEYEQWDADPEPKENWLTYSIGAFPTWAAPLLEKERLYNLAKRDYELSDEDIKLINSNLLGETTGEVFESILSDLYEEEEEEEDDEEDEDSDEFEEYEEDEDEI